MKILLFVFFLISSLLRASDPHFSQLYMSGMYLNPALTGSIVGWQSSIQYRNQWPAINGYVTSNFGVQKQLTKFNTGLGIKLLNDQAGDATINTVGIGMNYSKGIILNKNVQFRIGAEVEFREKSIDFSSLNFGDEIDNRFGFIPIKENLEINNITSYLNFGCGTDLKVFKGNFGFALNNVFAPNESFTDSVQSPLPRRYTTYITYPAYSNDVVSVTPIVMYQKQKDAQQIHFGLATKYKIVSFYAGYRNQDALISGIGLALKRLKIQYSYDLTVSKLLNETGGSHEIGVLFRFGSKDGYDDANFIF
jgi:type IX secretion system PorP/SprF family membrane protein